MALLDLILQTSQFLSSLHFNFLYHFLIPLRVLFLRHLHLYLLLSWVVNILFKWGTGDSFSLCNSMEFHCSTEIDFIPLSPVSFARDKILLYIGFRHFLGKLNVFSEKDGYLFFNILDIFFWKLVILNLFAGRLSFHVIVILLVGKRWNFVKICNGKAQSRNK